MADASKLQYYTGYNAYKNLGVHPGSISITNDSVAAGAIRTWSSTVSVEPDSKFASARIQINRDNFPTGVTALRWAAFPSANKVWQTLSTDPDGRVTQALNIYLNITDDQATFSATTFNDGAGALAFNAFSIGFVYSVHTLAV